MGPVPGQVSAGHYDAFLRKYDSEGVELWAKQFGSTGPAADDSAPTPNLDTATPSSNTEPGLSEPMILEASLARDITLIGFDPYDKSGSAVAIGDLNGDGVPDIAIGALLGAAGDRRNTGETYVLFGPVVAGTYDLGTSADITLNGLSLDDRSGAALAIGDLNGDGILDLAIGAYGAAFSRGETYVIFGPLAAGVFELPHVADVILKGIEPGDISGYDLAAGDLNLDGVPDLVISAPAAGIAGKAYVIFGPLNPGVSELADVVDVTIEGTEPINFVGSGLAVGDLNMDGAPDLVIGALSTSPEERANTGQTYVVFGPLDSGILDLTDIADITFNGIDPGDQSGWALAVGDLNGDGDADLAIGAYRAGHDGRSIAGQSYIVSGPLAAGSYELASDADIVVNGIDPSDRMGYALTIGDVNGDGIPDIAIGAYWADPEQRVRAGETYVILGPLSP